MGTKYQPNITNSFDGASVCARRSPGIDISADRTGERASSAGPSPACSLFFYHASCRARRTISRESPFMRTLSVLAIVLLSLAAPARAADDVAAAQGVIRSQVEAFSRDDAAAAYSYAAPAIREIFPQADIFMSMVRNLYAPVYRHKRFEFGEARVSDGTIAQRVHIVDADGIPWEALYTLELQPDGSVKITGCVLLNAGQPV
jgi:hypothetical protein